MKKIEIYMWHGSNFPNLDLVHHQEFEYTKEKRNELVDLIISKKLKVMISDNEESCTLYIDSKMFRQGS